MKRGFALVEVLIVIVIIAILAAIVIPRFLDACEKAKESDLRQDLFAMRIAVRMFEAQCGDFPAQLSDIISAEVPKNGGNGRQIRPSDFHGPYLLSPYNDRLPKNPITDGNLEGVDWMYDATTGEVRAASGIARDGTNYSTW